MEQHDEFDLLSAFLDGELEPADRTRLDAHLTTCGDCRGALAGLRATLADLETLPEPVPTPQDSWALRAAIRRARSPVRRWQRYAYAAGAVAAAAITFVAITLPGGNPSRDLSGAPGLERSLAHVPVITSTQNLTALEAQRRLLELAGVQSSIVASPQPAFTDGAAALSAGSGTTDSAGSGPPGTREQSNAYAADSVQGQIDRCVSVVRDSTQVFLDPLKFEVATFEDEPAFLLYFRVSDHYELWVTRSADCELLYFAQTS
ncbi:MAG: anti-sigma factor family protein [Actinomycetota bacterium]